MGVGDQRHALAGLPRELPGTHCTGGWVAYNSTDTLRTNIQFRTEPVILFPDSLDVPSYKTRANNAIFRLRKFTIHNISNGLACELI
jgi:hypothetical protein